MDNGQVVSVDGEASNKRSSLKDVKFTYELKIVPGAGSDFSAPIEVSFGDADREVAFSAGVGVNVVPYKHSSLRGPNSIRILTLLPSAEFDSPIDVQLAEVDLPSKPDYEALSYAWGDTKNKVGISCHGRRLDVTVNCALALQNLRHEYQARTLWVDAICIDQTLANEAERNQQVRIMGNVYETAQRVLVWLGPRGAKSDLEIAMLKSFEKVVGEDNATQDAFAERVYDQLKGALIVAYVSGIITLRPLTKTQRTPVDKKYSTISQNGPGSRGSGPSKKSHWRARPWSSVASGVSPGVSSFWP